jgi:peptidoglycan/LPS O-acetylase OafA/YrhL
MKAQQNPWVDQFEQQNNLNLMRFLFAVLVIFSHSYPLLYGETAGNNLEPFSILTKQQITGGRLAVAFFFILSGFLITQSWQRSRHPLDYFIRRVLRIYPAFIVMSLICVYVIAPLILNRPLNIWIAESNIPPFIFYQILLYFPGDGRLFTTNPIPGELNGSAWTIRYEFWCYILLACLGILGILRTRKYALIIFILWMALYACVNLNILDPTLPFENGRTFLLFGNFAAYIEFVSFFLAGSLFFLYREKIPYSLWMFILSLLILFFTAWLGVGLLLSLPIFGAYIIFYLGFSKRKPSNQQKKPFDISYGTYLYGYPIQQLLVYYFFAQLNPFLLFIIALSISVVLAALSWHFIEQPMIRMRERFVKLNHINFAAKKAL